jgi:prevent-host-death family protein
MAQSVAKDPEISDPGTSSFGKPGSPAQSTSLLQADQQTRTIAAGEFKAKCLKLLDQVAETRQPLIITKFGKPVAKLVPVEEAKNVDLFGAMRGSVIWEGDIISPLDVEWDAMK